MRGGVSEIDDPDFFLAKDGKYNAKSELDATIYALLNETRYDDNATACKFPARKAWLEKELAMKNLPKVACKAYQKIFDKLNPTTATIIFPSAHINSPASMFGHTFLRINSTYQSKLLSYAINYAANMDVTKTNGVIYAIKGLTGSYPGYYSMLPYYDKLKEYRDSEQRDIWEYDLNLSQKEVSTMFKHIWELNGIYSDYYFFTENCSYNMLWLLELARPKIHLKEYFTYQVSPLETIHAMKDEGLIVDEKFRASKRRVILAYEKAIHDNYHTDVNLLLTSDGITLNRLLNDDSIAIQQKRYMLEAAIELLEYKFIQAKITKKKYLTIFHTLTVARATLGKSHTLSILKPSTPLNAHRQARVTLGIQSNNSKKSFLLGIRPVYHNIEDNDYGLLRGTQIEFLNTLFKISENKINIEKLTLLSISSFSQISDFMQPFSWRTHFQWDRENFNNRLGLNVLVGAGESLGNKYGYLYFVSDIFSYLTKDVTVGADISTGFVLDKSQYFQTNVEATQRWYSNGKKQLLFHVAQSYNPTHNTQIKLQYTYQKTENSTFQRKQLGLLFNYYF